MDCQGAQQEPQGMPGGRGTLKQLGRFPSSSCLIIRSPSRPQDKAASANKNTIPGAKSFAPGIERNLREGKVLLKAL